MENRISIDQETRLKQGHFLLTKMRETLHSFETTQRKIKISALFALVLLTVQCLLYRPTFCSLHTLQYYIYLTFHGAITCSQFEGIQNAVLVFFMVHYTIFQSSLVDLNNGIDTFFLFSIVNRNSFFFFSRQGEKIVESSQYVVFQRTNNAMFINKAHPDFDRELRTRHITIEVRLMHAMELWPQSYCCKDLAKKVIDNWLSQTNFLTPADFKKKASKQAKRIIGFHFTRLPKNIEKIDK